MVTFVEPGESGENLDLPALTAARKAVQRGKYDILVTYTLGRLTWDTDDLFLLRREFQSVDIETWAVHDGPDITIADIDDLLQVIVKGYFGHQMPAGESLTAQLVHVDQQVAERETEITHCLELYVRGTIPMAHLDAKAQELVPLFGERWRHIDKPGWACYHTALWGRSPGKRSSDAQYRMARRKSTHDRPAAFASRVSPGRVR